MTEAPTLPDIRESLSHSSSGLTIDWDSPWEHEWSAIGVRNALVGDSERERAFRERIREVNDYRSLPKNWDTYGGLPACDAPARFASSLLEEVRWLPEILAPYVCPISTGAYIQWQFGDAKLYFEIDEASVLFVMEESGVVVEDGEDAAFNVRRAVELVQRFHRSAF